jgi:aminoglycoside phosphotransferase (APT) family kinase protein
MGIDLVVSLLRQNGYKKVLSPVMVHNRGKNVLFFLLEDGEPAYFAKLARCAENSGFIEKEYSNLMNLHTLGEANPVLGKAVPRVILFSHADGRALLITDWLWGRKKFGSDFSPSLYARVLSWLLELQKHTVRPSFLDKEYLLKYVNRYAYQMPDRPLGKDTGALFDELIREIAWLGQGISKSCYAHNDLSISNILFNGDKLFVIDWVAADEEGLPFVDAFELVLYLVNRRLGSYPRSLKELFTGRIREQSMLKMAAKKYSVDFGLNGDALRWLMRLAIFSKIHRFRSCGRSDRSEELKESFYFLKSIPSAQILPDR